MPLPLHDRERLFVSGDGYTVEWAWQESLTFENNRHAGLCDTNSTLLPLNMAKTRSATSMFSLKYCNYYTVRH